MTISLNNGKNLLFVSLFLAIQPILSHATDCNEIKEQYWKCVRSSMTNEACESNVSIPPECLKSKTKTHQNYGSHHPSTSHFFDSKKKSPSVTYSPKESVPKKAVKIVNVKPPKGKMYFETQEDVENYTIKIKEDLLNGIKEGKKVRLTFD